MRRGGWDDAVALVEDGSTVAFSGAVLRGKPVAAARALARAGKRDLDLVTFTGSLEVELLLAAGALRTRRLELRRPGPARPGARVLGAPSPPARSTTASSPSGCSSAACGPQ